MIMFKRMLFVLALLPALIFAEENSGHQITPVATELRIRMPEWRTKIVQQFSNGTPQFVLFYAENDNEIEEAVKQIQFFENGRPLEETDLITVDEKSRSCVYTDDGIEELQKILNIKNLFSMVIIPSSVKSM